MLQFEANKGVEFCDGLTRRDFLRAGALSAGAVGLSLADLALLQAAPNRPKDINCILLFLVGGPSHLDTWDLKPDAPSEVRGPFRPTRTSVPGVEICEHFPLMAKTADRYAVVRSVHHREAPIHETGHQLMQTGRLFRGGQEHPHYGAALSRLRGPRSEGMPASAVLPARIGNTGVSVSHGQGAGHLGAAHEPFVLRADPGRLASGTALLGCVDEVHRAADAAGDSDPVVVKLFSPPMKRALDLTAEGAELRERYGRNSFGHSCLLARRMVEAGVRLVTVNMFETVFDNLTWDCHADGGALGTTLDDYRDILCPMFDRAYAALLDDLAQRGLLDTTLVLAMGEFGRTPRLNPRGGRDHWPGCWSVLFAGAGVRGGQVVGSSDATGSEPKDRPVRPAEVAATVYAALGIDPASCLPGPDGRPLPLADAAPVAELF
jgi:uncharacterized protein (DUF1501 family)